jgi:hypothetical protein
MATSLVRGQELQGEQSGRQPPAVGGLHVCLEREGLRDSPHMVVCPIDELVLVVLYHSLNTGFHLLQAVGGLAPSAPKQIRKIPTESGVT